MLHQSLVGTFGEDAGKGAVVEMSSFIDSGHLRVFIFDDAQLFGEDFRFVASDVGVGFCQCDFG